MPAKNKTPDFEQSLKSLEALVNRMEQGNLPLDEALQAFEEGVNLSRQCRNLLNQAEQKVQVLTESNTGIEAEPFTTNSDNNSHT